MIQRLLLLCALAFGFCGSAYGLGLGKLDLQSALNQEFKAEIELTNVRGLELDEMIPGLAAPSEFSRAGIERSYLLTDLRFKVVRNANGKFVVQVSSNRPIVEPFLNFIVEVLWPNGRILREYTVLLDPPVFGNEGVQAIRPASSAASASQSARRQSPATSQASQSSSPAAATSSRNRLDQGAMSGNEYGMTGPGDTLWAIALETRPASDLSVQQTMLAIQRANPEAFINNNINLLKAGHVLRIPDAAEIRQQTFASAVDEVQNHNEEFQAYRSGTQVTQLDASGRQASRSGETSGRRDEGELRLVASDSSSGRRAGSGSTDSALTQQLEDELSVAREDLDRARRNSADMSSQLGDLQDQVETLNNLVTAKDDQLAALRAQVQRMQAASEAAPAQPAAPETTYSDSLLTNPLVLGGLAGLVVLGAAGGLYFMRRRKQNESLGDDDELDSLSIAEESASDEVDDDATRVSALQVQEEEEEVSQQTSDVISEVEIYIAYGRFPQAISFLQNAIEAEPNRADIQLKLLEVYVQTEDATAFNLQFDQLKMLGDEAATAQALQLQQKIPGAAEVAEAAMDATIVSNEPIAAIEEPADDDDMSFDLDDLDSETEDDAFDLDLDDEGADVDINLDDDDDAEPELTLDDGDLDLGLEADSDDDDGLDLDGDDLELDLDGDDDSSDGLELSLGDDDDIELDLGDDDDDPLADLAGNDELNLDDDDGIELSLDDDDDAIELDLGDDDDDPLGDLGGDDELSLDDDDGLELNLDDDDDDGAIELDLGDDDDDPLADLGGDDELSLDDDDGIELNLDDDDDGLELDLGGDDDDGLELDLGGDDDDDLELNLDEDASTKLDLARAYIDMGDSDGAKNVLEEVINEGSDDEIVEANELLAKIG